jgi:hypothetical protein
MESFGQSSNQAYRAMTDEERAVAEKGWRELTTEQKVERLRVVLRSHEFLVDHVTSLQNKLYELEKHEHGQDGGIVIPFGMKNPQGLGLAIGNNLKPHNPLHRLF